MLNPSPLLGMPAVRLAYDRDALGLGAEPSEASVGPIDETPTDEGQAYRVPDQGGVRRDGRRPDTHCLGHWAL